MELAEVRGYAVAFGVVAAVVISGSESAHAAQCGRAAWFDLTGVTASGEPADAGKLTAAHRSLPFQTKVRVENLGNGRSVVVRINDRGPFTRGRVIDVSKSAAQELGFINAGTARVRITVVDGDRGALPTTCEGGESPTIEVASISIEDVPAPRLRPIDEIIPANAEVVDIEPVSGDITRRFDDAFAPEPEDLTLVEPLLEKAESMPEVMPLDPHHGSAPREEWDQLQGVPN